MYGEDDFRPTWASRTYRQDWRSHDFYANGPAFGPYPFSQDSQSQQMPFADTPAMPDGQVTTSNHSHVVSAEQDYRKRKLELDHESAAQIQRGNPCLDSSFQLGTEPALMSPPLPLPVFADGSTQPWSSFDEHRQEDPTSIQKPLAEPSDKHREDDRTVLQQHLGQMLRNHLLQNAAVSITAGWLFTQLMVVLPEEEHNLKGALKLLDKYVSDLQTSCGLSSQAATTLKQKVAKRLRTAFYRRSPMPLEVDAQSSGGIETDKDLEELVKDDYPWIDARRRTWRLPTDYRHDLRLPQHDVQVLALQSTLRSTHLLEPLIERELYWAMPIAPVDRRDGSEDYTWGRKTLHQVLEDGHSTLPDSDKYGQHAPEVENSLTYGVPTTCPVVDRVIVAMRSNTEEFIEDARPTRCLENEIIGHRLIAHHGEQYFDQRMITSERFSQKGTSAVPRITGSRHDQGT
ncbi:hypothetical protein CBER1_07304 [Cercospora berteroae]|uniref:Uncharacterized protein n=1 Tax=Cercospora berteroae TaxID=357750 RepID=A0A2S6CEX1_9PEZI|nr:hypothetical protein CBER1_07304 [Cercospora berteroae]